MAAIDIARLQGSRYELAPALRPADGLGWGNRSSEAQQPTQTAKIPTPYPSSRSKMNPLANLALSVRETLVHEAGRLLFGIALGRAKELLGTPQQLGTRQLALNRALQRKQ